MVTESFYSGVSMLKGVGQSADSMHPRCAGAVLRIEVGGNGLAIAVFPCLTTHLCTSVRDAAVLIWASAT